MGIMTSSAIENDKTSSDEAYLSAIENVKIDDDGVFKYVLIKCSLNSQSKHIVRGFGWAEYHADIYEDEEQKILPLGVRTQCLGGGRIQHKPDSKEILVYGYSVGFGRADHSIAVKLLQEKFPGYSKITFSNDGY